MRILMLDLEGTIIDNWNTYNLIPSNIDYVNQLIKGNHIDAVGIYSYAVWCQANLDELLEKFDFWAEKFDAPLKRELILPVWAMTRTFKNASPNGKEFAVGPFWDHINKEHAFLEFANELNKTLPANDDPLEMHQFHLFDDTVPDRIYGIGGTTPEGRWESYIVQYHTANPAGR